MQIIQSCSIHMIVLFVKMWIFLYYVDDNKGANILRRGSASEWTCLLLSFPVCCFLSTEVSGLLQAKLNIKSSCFIQSPSTGRELPLIPMSFYCNGPALNIFRASHGCPNKLSHSRASILGTRFSYPFKAPILYLILGIHCRHPYNQ